MTRVRLADGPDVRPCGTAAGWDVGRLIKLFILQDGPPVLKCWRPADPLFRRERPRLSRIVPTFRGMSTIMTMEKSDHPRLGAGRMEAHSRRGIGMPDFTSEELFREYRRIGHDLREESGPGQTRLLGWDIEYTHPSAILAFLDHILFRGMNDFFPDNDRPLILDCGANIGYTVLNYRRLFPGARIVAFEPDPLFAPVLRRNLARNGAEDVEVVESAAWIADGTAAWLTEGVDGSRLIGETGAGQNAATVRTVDLAQYLDREIDLLKCDIEGAEFVVIPHLGRRLGVVRNILVECHVTGQEAYAGLTEIIRTLVDAGFKIAINSYGPWRDLVRRHVPRPLHAEQYLLVAGWRSEHPRVSTEETFLPYTGIAGPMERSFLLTQLEEARALLDQRDSMAKALADLAVRNREWKTRRLTGRFRHEEGHCWYCRLSLFSASAGDSLKDPARSSLILYENDRLLGPPHAVHSSIRVDGGGRYSHWHSALYFSTSDGSDPNTNGRAYTAIWK